MTQVCPPLRTHRWTQHVLVCFFQYHCPLKGSNERPDVSFQQPLMQTFACMQQNAGYCMLQMRDQTRRLYGTKSAVCRVWVSSCCTPRMCVAGLEIINLVGMNSSTRACGATCAVMLSSRLWSFSLSSEIGFRNLL